MHLDGSDANEVVKTRPASQSSCFLADLTLVRNKSTLRWLQAIKEDVSDFEKLSGSALDWKDDEEDLRKAKALLAELEVKVVAMPAEELAAAKAALETACPPLQQKNENAACIDRAKKGPPSPAKIKLSQTVSMLGMKRDCERNIAYLRERAIRSEEEENELKVERNLLAEVEAEIAATPAEDLAAAEARIAENHKIRRT